MKKAIGIAVRLTIIAILFSLVLNHDRQDARGAGTKQGRDGFAISSNGEVINYSSLALELAESQNSTEFDTNAVLPFVPVGLQIEEEDLRIPDNVIGEDNRHQITNTTIFPWTAVVI